MYKFAESFMSDEAYYFYLGRVALYAILKCLGVKENDEVILQAFTCFEVPTAVIMSGAKPIFADIDPNTLNVDSNKLKSKITSKTKAIIVQHTFGIPTEMDAIIDVAHEKNILVIEDCCHSFGSEYLSQETGTYGDAAFYSFGWIKQIPLGLGGVAIINNKKYKYSMEELYTHFNSPTFIESFIFNIQQKIFFSLYNPNIFYTLKSIYHNKYIHKLLSIIYGNIDTNYVDIEDYKQILHEPFSKKIIPSVKKNISKSLKKYYEIVEHQNMVVDIYRKILSASSYKQLSFDERYSIIYYKYPILSEHKKKILQLAKKNKIELSEMFRSPLHPKELSLWKLFGYNEGDCPISEEISEKIIPLSVHKKINRKELNKIKVLLNLKA